MARRALITAILADELDDMPPISTPPGQYLAHFEGRRSKYQRCTAEIQVLPARRMKSRPRRRAIEYRARAACSRCRVACWLAGRRPTGAKFIAQAEEMVDFANAGTSDARQP